MTDKVLIGIVMGSDSDWETVQETTKILDKFGIVYEINVISAHRTPEKAYEYAKSVESRGLKVVIAAAGGAAHLPGVLAALTNLPVIGIPIQTNLAGGIDSLLSIVQMPGGVPVATMSVGKPGARNAGIFAVKILSLSIPDLKLKLTEFRNQMVQEVESKNRNLNPKNI